MNENVEKWLQALDYNHCACTDKHDCPASQSVALIRLLLAEREAAEQYKALPYETTALAQSEAIAAVNAFLATLEIKNA